MPRTTGVSDTSNVDDEFLNEMPEETPMEANVLLTIHNSDAMFENFSFVNESNIIKTDPNTTAQTGQSKS